MSSFEHLKDSQHMDAGEEGLPVSMRSNFEYSVDSSLQPLNHIESGAKVQRPTKDYEGGSSQIGGDEAAGRQLESTAQRESEKSKGSGQTPKEAEAPKGNQLSAKAQELMKLSQAKTVQIQSSVSSVSSYSIGSSDESGEEAKAPGPAAAPPILAQIHSEPTKAVVAIPDRRESKIEKEVSSAGGNSAALSKQSNANRSIFKRQMTIKQTAAGTNDEFIDVEINWTQKDQNIIDKLNYNVKSIMEESRNLKQYNNDSDKDDKSSIGSVSSADVRDLELIMSGEHTNYFQAYELIKQFEELKEQKRENLDFTPSEGRWFECKRFVKNLNCKTLKESCKNYRNKKKKKKSSVDQRLIDLYQNQQGKTTQEQRPKRSGKELWKIAKKLVKAESKINLAQNILRLNREIKAQRQLEEQRKLEQQQREQQSNLAQQIVGNDKNNGLGNQILEEENLVIHNYWSIANMHQKAIKLYKKHLIEPNNRKLKYFHLLVAAALLWDFILTGWIMSNYRFHIGREPDFLNHQKNYAFICFVQGVDIILNFLKIEINSQKKIDDPKELFSNYIRGSFVTDCVAVFPYSTVKSSFIFLRYLKLIKFQTYLKYFEESLIELTQNFLSGDSIKILIQLFRLSFQIIMTSHFFACLWVLIGQYDFEHGKGWLHVLIKDGIQGNGYWDCYITSLYWVIATFSSVGYGDVVGKTPYENLFQLLVEMVGICFFGYMIGTFQNILHDIGGQDPLSHQQESIDYWLIKLDKAIKNRQLGQQIYSGVKNFYNNQFKFETSIVQESEFYIRLKPKLQRQVLDFIFSNFYSIFKDVLKGCDLNFKREIFKNCTFTYYLNGQDLEDIQDSADWIKKNENPVLEKAQTRSNKVHFIISGQIHVMNKDGQYEYGVLNEGSYFGDISLLLNEANEFSYYYNPYSEKAINLLQIDGDVFMKICENNPVCHEILLNRAQKRKRTFKNFKITTLISYMRTLKKSPKIVTKKLVNNTNLLQRVQIMKLLESKIKLFGTFIKHYELYKASSKINARNSKTEQKQNNKKSVSSQIRSGNSLMSRIQNNLNLGPQNNSEGSHQDQPRRRNEESKEVQITNQLQGAPNINQENNSNQTGAQPDQDTIHTGVNAQIEAVRRANSNMVRSNGESGLRRRRNQTDDRTAFESDDNQSQVGPQQQEEETNQDQEQEQNEEQRTQNLTIGPNQNTSLRNFSMLERQQQALEEEKKAEQQDDCDMVNNDRTSSIFGTEMKTKQKSSNLIKPNIKDIDVIPISKYIIDVIPKSKYSICEEQSFEGYDQNVSIEKVGLLRSGRNGSDKAEDLRKPKKTDRQAPISTVAKEKKEINKASRDKSSQPTKAPLPHFEMKKKNKNLRSKSNNAGLQKEAVLKKTIAKKQTNKKQTQMETSELHELLEHGDIDTLDAGKASTSTNMKAQRLKSAQTGFDIKRNTTKEQAKSSDNMMYLAKKNAVAAKNKKKNTLLNNLMWTANDENGRTMEDENAQTLFVEANQNYEENQKGAEGKRRNSKFDDSNPDEDLLKTHQRINFNLKKIERKDDENFEGGSDDDNQIIEGNPNFGRSRMYSHSSQVNSPQGLDTRQAAEAQATIIHTERSTRRQENVQPSAAAAQPVISRADNQASLQSRAADAAVESQSLKLRPADLDDPHKLKVLIEQNRANMKIDLKDYFFQLKADQGKKKPEYIPTKSESSSESDSIQDIKEQQKSSFSDSHSHSQNNILQEEAQQENFPKSNKKKHLTAMEHMDLIIEEFLSMYQIDLQQQKPPRAPHGNPKPLMSVQKSREKMSHKNMKTKKIDKLVEDDYKNELDKHGEHFKVSLQRQFQTQHLFKQVHDQGIKQLNKQLMLIQFQMKGKIQQLEEITAKRIRQIDELQKE